MKRNLLFISSVVLITLLSSAVGTTSGKAAAPSESGSRTGSLADSGMPNATCPPGGQCFADVPSTNSFFDFVNRIYQQDLVSGYACGGQGEPCDANNRPYYRPGAGVTRQQMAKFIDNARRLPEIHMNVDSGTAPIYSRNNTGTAIAAYSTSGDGVHGESTGGAGLVGISSINNGTYGGSTSGAGVYGSSSSNAGVYGISTSGVGTVGVSTSGSGVYGYSTNSWAGYFAGNVNVTGSCCGASAGTFRIDNPLDPANQYLYQSAVESPDMKNIYDGISTLDAGGEAWVELPSYSQALNRDFRYQLTPIGGPGRDLYIAQEIDNNRFKIAGGKAGMKVSWQVTGIRQDPYANAHRTPVEVDKPANEKGTYLHPTELGQPESLSVEYEKQQSLMASPQAMDQDNR